VRTLLVYRKVTGVAWRHVRTIVTATIPAFVSLWG